MRNVNFLLPFVGLVGGVKSTLEIAFRLRKRGWDAKIFYPIILSNLRRRANVLDSLRLIRRVLIRRPTTQFDFDFDVPICRLPVFSNRFLPDADATVATWWEDVLPLMRLSPGKGKKIHVIRHHETWFGHLDQLRRAYESETEKIVISSWLERVMAEEYNATCRGICPNGICTSRFHFSENRTDRRTRIQVGMMYRGNVALKGTEMGLHILQRIAEKHPNVDIVLFGEPLTHEVAFKNTTIIRPYGEDIRRIYSDLDIFIFTSPCEGFGNPPLEAMACRTAVVSTSVGGVPDYCTDGVSGLLVNPEAPDEFNSILDRLIDNHALREKISLAAEKQAATFTWEKTVERFETILADIL